MRFLIKFVLIGLCALIGFDILRWANTHELWWGGLVAVLVWVTWPIIIISIQFNNPHEDGESKQPSNVVTNVYRNAQERKMVEEFQFSQTNKGPFKSLEEKTKFLNAMKKVAQDTQARKLKEFEELRWGEIARKVEENKQKYIRNFINQTIVRPSNDEQHLYKNVVEIVALVKKSIVTTNPYPTTIESKMQKAIELKRTSNYIHSLEVYYDIISNQMIAHTGILNGLWKVVASAGYCREAIQILEIGKIAMRESQVDINAWGVPNTFEHHLEMMNKAIINREDLIIYLKSVSGNPNYILPRDYSDIRNAYFKT